MSEQTELVQRQPLELDTLARLGTWLAALESGSDDRNAKGAAAALRFYYAAALELPPTAVAELSVIKGRLVMSAQLLRALAERRGYRVVRGFGSSAETCTAQVFGRDNVLLGETTFTIQDARAAGLVRERSGWQSYPARMLWARASALALRDYAPGVALGISTDDEMLEIVASSDGVRAADAVVEEIVDAELVEEATVEESDGPEPEPEPVEELQTEPEPLLAEGQRREIFALIRECGLDAGEGERDARLDYLSRVTGRRVDSSNELTATEARQVVAALRAVRELPPAVRAARIAGVGDEQAVMEQLEQMSEPEPAEDPQRRHLAGLAREAIDAKRTTIPGLWQQLASFRDLPVEELIEQLGGRDKRGVLRLAPLVAGLDRGEIADLSAFILAADNASPDNDIPF
jgi:hypothetical protein